MANAIPHDNLQQSLVTILKRWRTSGLLAALPAEELKSLLWILSFTSSTGTCQPTLPQLAHAMQISLVKARRRLEHLTQLHWQGQPVITRSTQPDGSESYVPVPAIIEPQALTEENPLNTAPADGAQPHASASVPPMVGSEMSGHQKPQSFASSLVAPDRRESNARPGNERPRQEQPKADRPLAKRETVIEASRRKYGRSREEVERIIEEQFQAMGITTSTKNARAGALPPPTLPLSPAQEGLRKRLLEAGVDTTGASALLAQYEAARIQRQLDWLPYRKVRNPAGFLISAIAHDYEAPVAWLSQTDRQHPQQGDRQDTEQIGTQRRI